MPSVVFLPLNAASMYIRTNVLLTVGLDSSNRLPNSSVISNDTPKNGSGYGHRGSQSNSESQYVSTNPVTGFISLLSCAFETIFRLNFSLHCGEASLYELMILLATKSN